MNNEQDALQVWQYMLDCPFAIFSPGDIAKHCFGERMTWGNSSTPEYARSKRALNILRDAGVLGKDVFPGTNQSVYWLKEKVK